MEEAKSESFQHPSRLINRKQLRVLLAAESEATLTRMLAEKTDPIPRVKFPRAHPKFPLDKVLWWIEKHSA